MEKREILQDRDYLQLFWDLSNDSQETRVKAAAALISYVETFRIEGNTSEFEKYRKYTFERLVKGLSSSRDSARLGFSLALSEVINLDGFTIDEVLNKIDSQHKVSCIN